MIRNKFRLVLLTTIFLAGFNQSTFAQSELPAAFVTNYGSDSITSFTLNADGSLNFVEQIAAGDAPQCISISADGKFLAVGHGTASSTVEELMIFQVNADATMTLRLTTLTPDSPLDCQWVSDTKLAVCKTNLSVTNEVIMYEWDDLNNSLTQIDTESTGSFNTALAFSPERNLLFANNSLGTDSIFSFSVDDSGMLTQNDNQLTNSIYPLGIGTSPDGNFVYAGGGISGTGNEILAFEVDASGALSPILGIQSPGDSPKVVAVSGDGNVLLAGHGSDATVQSFVRDPKTGLLSQSGFSFDVGTQGNLGDLVVMGDIMLVTDESSFDNEVQGLYSFRINSDGSLTQLGPIVDTQGSRPEYIAAWPGFEPDVIVADSFEVTRGNQSGGGLIELQSSDDEDLSVLRANADVFAITEIEVKAVSPSSTPTIFDITLESSVFARTDVTQTIALYNYDTAEFEELDLRPASRFLDATAMVTPTGDFSRFVENGTNCIRAQLTYESINPRQRFASNIDLFSWTIDRN